MLMAWFLENGCTDYPRLQNRDDFEGLEEREIFAIRPCSAVDSVTSTETISGSKDTMKRII
jgi:hypothetical protein